MKSPPKKRKGEPASDIEALYPPDADIDAHNAKVSTMLELLQRNQELKERVQELEDGLKLMVEIVNFCYKSKSIPGPDIPPEVTKALKGE